MELSQGHRRGSLGPTPTFYSTESGSTSGYGQERERSSDSPARAKVEYGCSDGSSYHADSNPYSIVSRTGDR